MIRSGAAQAADFRRIRRRGGNQVSGTSANDGLYTIERVSSDGKFLLLNSTDRFTTESTTEAVLTITATLQPGIRINARVSLPVSGTGNTGYAWASGNSGGTPKVAGVNATEATAQVTANVTAYTGTGVKIDAAGIVEINASARTRQQAIGTSKVLGIVALGGNLAKAESNTTINATAGTGLRIAADELRINAFGDETNFAEAVSGTGGAVAGSWSQAETNSTGTTQAIIGSSAATYYLDKLQITADHTARFDGRVDSTSAGIVGLSGAKAVHTVDADVYVKIGNVSIPAYQIIATAKNSSVKMASADSTMPSPAPAVLDAPATISQSTISQDAGITLLTARSSSSSATSLTRAGSPERLEQRVCPRPGKTGQRRGDFHRQGRL